MQPSAYVLHSSPFPLARLSPRSQGRRQAEQPTKAGPTLLAPPPYSSRPAGGSGRLGASLQPAAPARPPGRPRPPAALGRHPPRPRPGRPGAHLGRRLNPVGRPGRGGGGQPGRGAGEWAYFHPHRSNFAVRTGCGDFWACGPWAAKPVSCYGWWACRSR